MREETSELFLRVFRIEQGSQGGQKENFLSCFLLDSL
uniref:Uncharacterized protein n=1 Tax=Arundo donax TaxID=35708 RepID=A0A0A8XX63_ARUDO